MRAEEEVEAHPASAPSLAVVAECPCYRACYRAAVLAPEEFRLSVHSECVRVSGFPITHIKELHQMSFADLGVSRPIVDALKRRGVERPFPVQELVIGDVLAGHDVLVQSPTGS